ncbi:LysR family transcriptional regulator [Vibrio sp. VB16]|uniref:LysR family transcriptional regulator n=1 Tax=Vibrio sp. VB16 TaxID=2785746 RepID=UPI00189F01B4|nr:LysR family transcriptional regulator [Vibrio sp. VB16]UGA55712.1 LysR family transcriptional regulator [Vibrio sp. VB16]
MKIENLEAFVTIAKLRSFTQAADVCFCTQATISQRLKNLENYFKAQLFDRVGRNIELTESGRRILPYCQSALVAIHQSKIELEAINGLSTGNLLLCSSNTPGIYLLPQVLADFHMQYPGVLIESRIKYAKDVIQEISFEGEAELGLISQPNLIDDKKLCFEPVLRDQLTVIASPNHNDIGKWKSSGKISLKDLQKNNLLVSNSKSSILQNLERASDEKIDFNNTIVLGSMEAVKKSVMLNSGIAIVSNFLVEEEIEDGKLCSFDISGVEMQRQIMLIYRSNCSLSPAAEMFIQTLKTDLSDKYPYLYMLDH